MPTDTSASRAPSRPSGPLSGVRIVELAGLGPAPFACMMLADHGAEVICVERFGSRTADTMYPRECDVLGRNRKTIAVDLKSAEGLQIVKDLAASADGLVEGFRPGVMERLGLGPDVMIGANPKLVYGRMTGWGQTGPYAQSAGHDINYIALSGVLDPIGPAGGKPVPPLNLVGDFGGGGMFLAFGMVSAILHAKATGQGQVIDCAMTDGSALLSGMIHAMRAGGNWNDERGTNMLDGGPHFYNTYETADGKYVSIGSIEPQFYALLKDLAGLGPEFDSQMDPKQWPSLTEKLAEIFRTKSRDEWCAIMEGTDICFAPVLSLGEAPHHPHNKERGTFSDAAGFFQPMPAPRFSLSPPQEPAMTSGVSSADTLLAGIGYNEDRIAELKAGNVVG